MSNENHPVVSRQQWIEARTQLLAREKQFTRERDELSAARRALPWVRVTERYEFERARGKATLADLFEGKRQLIIYHFMFAPDWQAGCKSCSFWADNFNGIVEHLAHRDVRLIAVSRAPVARLTAFARRLGWTFEWASSHGSSFNHDFGVSFMPDEIARGKLAYNYEPDYAARNGGGPEMPGISVFYRDGDAIYHTYSCYSRGLDMLNTAYHYLDLVPRGRDEGDRPMSWLRLRDEYGA